MRKGFTLVELSVVFVIVGLLVGGILVAQSMISTAKINAQIRQFTQLDIAITNFQTKYNVLPGDSPFHAVPGDGNGIIDNSQTLLGTDTVTLNSYDYEISNFWPHLQQDGVFDKEYPAFSNNAALGAHVKTHFPMAKVDPRTGIAPFASTLHVYKFYYVLADFEKTSSINITANISANFPVTETFALDKKIDDGIARGSNNYTYSGKMFISTYSPNCYDPVTFAYILNSGANRIFYVAMQGQTIK